MANSQTRSEVSGFPRPPPNGNDKLVFTSRETRTNDLFVVAFASCIVRALPHCDLRISQWLTVGSWGSLKIGLLRGQWLSSRHTGTDASAACFNVAGHGQMRPAPGGWKRKCTAHDTLELIMKVSLVAPTLQIAGSGCVWGQGQGNEGLLVIAS